MCSLRRACLLTLLVALFGSSALASTPLPSVAWIGQEGSTENDWCRGVAVDGLGHVYVSGWTAGALAGPSAGGYDAFVSRYTVDGELLWTRQFGTNVVDVSHCTAVDEVGNVYLSGYTQGSLVEPNAGGLDVYVRKYTPEGNLAWTRQWGTSEDDLGCGISADRMGNVYVTGLIGQGYPSKSFVRKYSTDGDVVWDRQLTIGTMTYSFAASADGVGNVYISGTTGTISHSGADAFVSKYTDDGTLAWTRIVNSGQSFSVSADGLGNVYLVSGVQSNPGGEWDILVSKYSDAGDLSWTRQWGTSATDMSYAVSADKWGNVFVAGNTNTNVGCYGDALVVKYTAEGDLAWDMQLGGNSSAFDEIRGAAADGHGNVYLAGWTADSLGGNNAGGYDALVVKINDVPEPNSFLLLGLGALTLLGQRRICSRKRS